MLRLLHWGWLLLLLLLLRRWRRCLRVRETPPFLPSDLLLPVVLLLALLLMQPAIFVCAPRSCSCHCLWCAILLVACCRCLA